METAVISKCGILSLFCYLLLLLGFSRKNSVERMNTHYKGRFLGLVSIVGGLTIAVCMLEGLRTWDLLSPRSWVPQQSQSSAEGLGDFQSVTGLQPMLKVGGAGI